MTDTITRLEKLLRSGATYLKVTPESDLKHKPLPGKWSKQEILGHLIDSGVNNLQRFTEIQSAERPFRIRKYKQDELVIANAYQDADMSELLQLWLALNRRILEIMEKQTETMLDYQIGLPDGQLSDLRFLMIDYVDHLEYHLKQIMN